MIRTYQIRGGLQQGAAAPTTSDIAITGHRRLVPGLGREAGAAGISAAGDEVVRVELENGFVLWIRADDLVRERGHKTTDRDGGEGWTIDPRPASAKAGSRGWLGLGIKVLDFFGVDLKGKTAAFLCDKAELKQLDGNAPGLYRCSLDDAFELSAMPDDAVLSAGPAPILIFLHGTGSSCQGSFGKLWQGAEGAEARRRMKALYGERVYALEHRSLTVSPIRNALDLLKHLPEGAQLHLVSHSRGGLVGELLCLGERDKTDDPLKADLLDSLFAADRTVAEQLGLSPLHPDAEAKRDAEYAAERAELKQLLDLLDARRIKVGRFVRVACPARGTTLASGRLDRWLSVLDHFAGKGFVGDVADFMLAVVKERTDPRTLPGLEAMMPGSAVTRMLQHPALVTAADLSVISGDIEGDTLWGQIKLLAVDWFYGADHDLVVNTGSMYGGIRRPDQGARFQFDRGPEVCHFNYFANKKSIGWLVAGLSRADGSDGGFQPMAAAKKEEPKWREAVRRSRTATTPRPLAVVLPGTMGSAIKVQGDAIWLNYWALLKGGLGRLRMGAAGVEPTDLLSDFYGPLLEFLARSHRVEIFPYDWRLSVRDAATKLADRLEAWLPEIERQGQPVHLVAHSMGGLVVRAMIADGGRGEALWRRITALPNSRFMMLGTPNLGSYEAVRWLTGCNPTEAKISLLDFAHSTDQIIGIVNNFPGLLELLPFDPDSPDFSQAARWGDLKQALKAHWPTADAGALVGARDSWNLLKQATPDPKHMVYVAGCQDATVADYRLTDYDEDWLAGRKRLVFDATARGDGTVTWKSGFLPGVPVWYVNDTAHDELCSRKDALPGYLDLLMTGATKRLPETPPAGARAAVAGPELFAMPETPLTDDLPDELDVAHLGFGPGRPKALEEVAAVPAIRVNLRHGDLAYARHPVLVGHYLGDTILNAELRLDDRLGHALSRRLQLGLYPGQAGTHAVFFSESRHGHPGGALVVGLGQVGELSTAVLQTGVRHALLDYALQVAQWPDDRFGGDGVRSAAVTCLLVGTGPGGVTVRDSVEAVLRAAIAANQRLERSGLNGRVLIDHVEFLELYEDVAIAASEALTSILEDGELAGAVDWTNQIVEKGEGQRWRVRCDDTPGWWHRLEIVKDQGGGLRFIASTDRARAEVTQSTGQLRLADRFIRRASQSPGRDADAAKVLFEMLLPNRLKELAPRQTDMVLLVDEASAAYPWELLEDRWSQTGMPPAVSAGLIRQLKTPSFRAGTVHAAEATAYVVGNPDLEGWRLFPDLPGARQEAQQVATQLSAGGYRVSSCIDEKYPLILDGLHRDAWRILHLAGHGEYRMPLELDGDDPERRDCGDEKSDETRPDAKRKVCVSGMVIGKDTFLTPGDVEQMRWVPELVFINCCHLGKTQADGRGDFNLLAANLGVQFIRMGVKAVVAAGWAVDDAAASTFAETFYRHMLAGETFGEAVRAAREEIWQRYADVNTWGAYQCYGDPGFRLHADGSAQPRRGGRTYHAPVELVVDLENRAEAIRMEVKERHDDEAELAAMHAGILMLLDGVPEAARGDWLARGDVAAALGFALGEAGALAEAVLWLEKAMHATKGDCPVRAIEQWANFRVRLAGQRWRDARATQAGVDSRDLADKIETAIRELDLVAQRAPTPERLSLLGSACKRLAWIQDDPTFRLEALVNMANYYLQAFELSGAADPYPFANWAVAKLLAVRLDPVQGGSWQTTLASDCRHMIELASERDAAEPSFWGGVAEADCELVLLLAGNDPATADADAARIAGLYRAAAAGGASPREYASVLEHLDFVADLLDDDPLTGAVAALRAAL